MNKKYERKWNILNVIPTEVEVFPPTCFGVHLTCNKISITPSLICNKWIKVLPTIGVKKKRPQSVIITVTFDSQQIFLEQKKRWIKDGSYECSR